MALKHPDLRRFMEVTVEPRVSDVKVATAFDLHGRVTLATPVDRGQARAGWNLTAGRVDLSAPDRPGPGQQLPPPLPPAIGRVPTGQSLFVTNNVNHIQQLNDGSSSQAPAGFFETSVNATIGFFENTVRTIVGQDGGL